MCSLFDDRQPGDPMTKRTVPLFACRLVGVPPIASASGAELPMTFVDHCTGLSKHPPLLSGDPVVEDGLRGTVAVPVGELLPPPPNGGCLDRWLVALRVTGRGTVSTALRLASLTMHHNHGGVQRTPLNSPFFLDPRYSASPWQEL